MMDQMESRDRLTVGAFAAAAASQLFRRWKICLACIVFISATSLAIAVLFPREYVASMVVAPVESSLTDATSQLLSTSISLRSPFSLGGGPPPQMAAFLTTLKTPELAKRLAEDTRAENAILKPDALQLDLGHRTALVRKWLDRHVLVDQDVELQAWTLNIHHSDPDAALYLIGRLRKIGEDMLRRTAIQQYAVQHDYVVRMVSMQSEEATRQTLYNVLTPIDRALAVLRSGSSVATIVISEPFVPVSPTYPSRLMVLGGALIAQFIVLLLGFLAFVVRNMMASKQDHTH